MDFLSKLEKRITGLLELVITLFFGIILSTTILLVVLRYVFNSGIYGGNELISYLFVYTTALGAAVPISRDDHIEITVFVEQLPERVRKAADIISLFFIAMLNLVLIFLSVPWMKKVGSFESPTLRIPNGWVQFGVPLGCAAVVLLSVLRIVRLYMEGKHDSASC